MTRGIQTNAGSTGAGVYGEHAGSGPAIVGDNKATGPGAIFHSRAVEGVIVQSDSPITAAMTVVHRNFSSTGPALQVEHADGTKTAGLFKGNVIVTGDISFPGADCAEDFTVQADVAAEPGTVMTFDDAGELVPCGAAYERRVAGVIAGAGSHRPGIIMDKQPQSSLRRQPIALVGKVFCRVDAGYGTIEVGDLLTTSSTEGHAMKAVDAKRAFGAVIVIRRYLILLDYNASPNLGDCLARIVQSPFPFQAAEIDSILSRKADLLKGITSATMRDRIDMVNAARVDPAVIQSYTMLMPHRANDMLALMHEANYTTRIGVSLVALDYQPLYGVIADMVNPALTNIQRIACRDTCQRMQLEFSAAAKAVEVVGTTAAKATVNRFMGTLKAALDNFPPALPAPTAVTAIIAALGAVGNDLAAFLTAVANLPDALTGAITLSHLLGSDEDDIARQLVSEMHAQGILSRTGLD